MLLSDRQTLYDYTLASGEICESSIYIYIGVFLYGELFVQPEGDPTSVDSRLQEWWPLLLANASLAFVLNVMVAVVVKD